MLLAQSLITVLRGQMIRTSIVGASGYGGGEILRILLSHPEVTVAQVTSQRFSGKPVTTVHPNLRGSTDLVFESTSNLKECDVLFVSLPNGKSMEYMESFIKLAPKIIDLGADFRLKDIKTYNEWYTPHTKPELLNKFIYGLSELHRDEIKNASYIACGGCEATAINLALFPLVQENLIENTVIADVKIGSSAGGSHGNDASHHPERSNVIRSYQPTHHRHQAEIKQELGIDVEISATAVDIVRGILATIHTRLKTGIDEKAVWKAYRKHFGSEPFIRIIKFPSGLYRYPEPKLLWGTNFCDIGFEKSIDSNRLVVISAIDNLVKGTAGQAVQAMNLMFSLPETTGLKFTGLHPI